MLGVLDDEQLVATAMVGHDGHRGWVYYIAVDPARRDEGLGRTIARAAEDWLTERGVVKVQLMVRHSSHELLGFYEQLGYVDDGVTVMARWLIGGPDK